MNKFTEIIIHHSASPRSTTVEDIRQWHKEKGWRDIGYHYVIEEGGVLQVGQQLPATGIHCPPNNGRIGICVTGDNTTVYERWDWMQQLELIALVGHLRFAFPWIQQWDVNPHSKHRNTECPGLSSTELDYLMRSIEMRSPR